MRGGDGMAGGWRKGAQGALPAGGMRRGCGRFNQVQRAGPNATLRMHCSAPRRWPPRARARPWGVCSLPTRRSGAHASACDAAQFAFSLSCGVRGGGKASCQKHEYSPGAAKEDGKWAESAAQGAQAASGWHQGVVLGRVWLWCDVVRAERRLQQLGPWLGRSTAGKTRGGEWTRPGVHSRAPKRPEEERGLEEAPELRSGLTTWRQR